MKFIDYRYICLSLLALVACNKDVVPVAPGNPDDAIVLSAGISLQGKADTKAAAEYGDHSTHVALLQGTKISLQVSGTWTGHSPVDVVKTTTGTIGAETSNGSKHNLVAFSTTSNPVEQLYWDDYGTAAPANALTGRVDGLTIYSAAVNDASVSSAPAVSDWANLAWTVPADQKNSKWSTRDLIISNNVKNADTDNRYKWTQHSDGKLLEFKHAMSEITINLTAGEGFPKNGSDEYYFEEEPTVVLKGFHTSGNVNVTDGSLSNAGGISDIQTYCNTATKTGQHQIQRSAIVFPTRVIGASDLIAEITADGNVYKVNAEKLYAAISSDSYKLLSGKNYVLNILVNKTQIKVEATLKDWITVETVEVAPKIDVTTDYGSDGTVYSGDWSIYRSLAIAAGYDDDGNVDGINPAATYTSGNWNKKIYWPTHSTYYFFRGVSPTSSIVENEGGNDLVKVTDAKYVAGNVNSDLMIAIPRIEPNNGISATEGTIKMNFEYAMSKVEVRLKSTGAVGVDQVLIDANTVVEIVGGAYNKARIKMSDGLHDNYAEADKGDYTLNSTATPADGYTLTTLDAIVPQVLTSDVRFKITVTNSDSTKDVYYSPAITATPAVNEWEHGKHYIYKFDIKKTQIKLTATILDWVETEASEDVWF